MGCRTEDDNDDHNDNVIITIMVRDVDRSRWYLPNKL